MKKTPYILLILFSMILPVLAANSWPSPQGYVNDFAHVIPADQDQTLESLLGSVEQQTGAQIAVVTVPTVEGADIDGAAADLFKAWGIGKKGKDDGVLILVATQDHKMRIEVGYGLEPVITDGLAGGIIRQQMRPAFRQGDYGQGLIQGAAAVAQLIAQSEGVSLTGSVPAADADNGSDGFPVILVVLLFVFLSFGLSFLFNFLSGGRGGFFGGGGFYGGWGGGGFGGSGGGFGGFGGGGSGGGGASGGW